MGKVLYCGRDGGGVPVYTLRLGRHFPPKDRRGFPRAQSVELVFAVMRHAETINPDSGGDMQLVRALPW